MFIIRLILVTLISTLLFSCGGGGSNESSNNNLVESEPEPETWIEDVFESSNNFVDLCESPREENSAITGLPFDDLIGSTLDENNWLRSWTNENYLWYDEVTDINPSLYDSTLDYFDLLKTEAVTASGAPRDQFHFTVSTDEYQALSQSGVSAGYGMQIVFLSSLPYDVAIAYTEPNSPASTAGIERGARIISIDGANAVLPSSLAEVNILNAALSPSDGESYLFEIRDLGSTDTRFIQLTAENISVTPVQNVQTIDTDLGKVGYMLFNDHIATSESLLFDAVSQLESESITDLVLDLRYNGGGFLAIASQLSYMIAGNSATDGKTFESLVFNDKHPVFDPITGNINNPIPFYNTTVGFSTIPGISLPTLDLDRVFIIATENTCSASESIINSLQGIDVEVILIGNTTCGKPYGFYPIDNCGTTYFSVHFQAENDKDFGDYADGFAPAESNSLGVVSVPGCEVSDDFDHVLGDTNEAMLSTALHYRETGSCQTTSSKTSLNENDLVNSPIENWVAPKSSWLQNRILTERQ